MKLLTLDGYSIINRAYYGIRPLSTKEGVPTNAIYGFMNILNSLIERTQPDVIAAAFDLKTPTFRHKMYADYKAGRKAMPDDLREQIPLMKELDCGDIIIVTIVYSLKASLYEKEKKKSKKTTII